MYSKNKPKKVARNELPRLQIRGIIQEKKTNEFSIELSEKVAKLNKNDCVTVKFANEVFDEANTLLKDSDIQLYVKRLNLGEHVMIFYPNNKTIVNKKIEIQRISNIVKEKM